VDLVTVPLMWPLTGPNDVLDGWAAAIDAINTDPKYADSKKV